MALKVKATEQLIKIGTYAGTYRYVMLPELYTGLNQDKVIKEAALRSGVSRGVMQACWDAAGEVISCRRIIFTPDVDLKEALSNTAVQISCFDRTGKEVKRVTSSDGGDIEDPENQNGNTGGNGGNQGGGGNTRVDDDDDIITD